MPPWFLAVMGCVLRLVIRHNERMFICELKKIAVKGGKEAERVFCREIKKKSK